MDGEQRGEKKHGKEKSDKKSCAHDARSAEDINGQEASVAHALWIQNPSLLTGSQDYCIYAYQTLYGSLTGYLCHKKKNKNNKGTETKSTINAAVLHKTS